MKNSDGLSDSIPNVTKSPGKCEKCGATTRLHTGVCVSCLLVEGLEAGDEISRAVFESVIAEVNVPDKQWRLGDYEILDEIGRGGMGLIYLARQRHPQRIVAVKRVLDYHADSHETLRRFRHEADAAASLDHPNILPIYEVSESEDGLPFFSMKFAAGGSLRKIGRALHAEPRKCVQLIAKVARAVEYAHSKRILHRDLKPGNILLDDRGEPLVSDFGLARWLDANKDLTKSLTTFGTPGYIAPEQAEGKAADLTPAADVYSLGAILFELLAGRPPFLGSNALAVIRQAAETPAPKLRSVTHSYDRDLETICARCLERDPKARYQSAEDLAPDLERWLDGRPIVARPVSNATRLGRWSRRNPKLLATGAACLLLGAATMWFFRGELATKMLPPAPEKSIAVLPFSNLSKEEGSAYFADGVQDEILTDLAKVADLKVISRASTMQYKSGVARDLRQIGQQLGVAHVVEGSVQRAGNRVRINVQLVDARTDGHLWAQTYDRDLADVFAIQSEIAEQIVSQLKSKLSPQEKSAIEQKPTADLSAHDFYIRAKTLTAQLSGPHESQFEAVRLLNQAIERDPGFALAYYQLAHVHDWLYFSGSDHTPARLAMADAAIQSLARLLPNSGEAHLALGKHLYYGYRDYDRAREEFKRAQKNLPNDPEPFYVLGGINRRQGRWAEATKSLERALELDPQDPKILLQLSLTYLWQRRYADAERLGDREITLVPKNSVARAQRDLIQLEWRADPRPLTSTIREVVAQDSREAENLAQYWLHVSLCQRDLDGARRALAVLPIAGCYDERVPFPLGWCEGQVARMAGDNAAARAAFTNARTEAVRLVTEQPDYAEALCVLGMADAALGHKEDAIREGLRAVELLPVTKDAVNGSQMVRFLAVIYAWTGEKDLALQQLAILVSIPSPLSYGELRLHPYWDPLRGDPRFEQIVASLAPNEAPNAIPEKSIAVLPFQNLSRDPDNAFFADGVQDEILTDLARVADLKVISRASTMQYKSGVARDLRKIGEQLGAAHVVEGSVQRSRNRVRVNVQLVDVRTDRHLWAQTYDRELADVFAIQSDIAEQIVSQLKSKLSPFEKEAIEAKPTADFSAHDLYIRAKTLIANAQTTRMVYETQFEAVRLLNQAVERDPAFALAYYQLAHVHDWLYFSGLDHTPARLAMADAAIQSLVRLLPNSGEAHLALAKHSYYGYRDYDRARGELKLAQKNLPNEPEAFFILGGIDRRQGRWAEATKSFERAIELDPQNPKTLFQLYLAYVWLRHYADAERLMDRAVPLVPKHSLMRASTAELELDWHANTHPLHSKMEAVIADDSFELQNFASLWLELATCERDLDGARRALDVLPITGLWPRAWFEGEVARMAGDNAAARAAFINARTQVVKLVTEQPDYAEALSVLGMTDTALGHKEDAIREGLRAVELLPMTKDAIDGSTMVQNLAIIYAWTGEKDLALQQLAILVSIPSPLSYGELRLYPRWDPLRGDPRFEKVVEEAKKPVVLK